MDVVGHQHVRVQRAAFALQRFAQPLKIDVIILLVEETGAAVVAALHDVQRYTIEADSRASRHEGSIAEIEPDPCRRVFK